MTKEDLSTQKGKFKLDSYPSFIAAVGQEETKEELFSDTLYYGHCQSRDGAGKNIHLLNSASFLLAWDL